MSTANVTRIDFLHGTGQHDPEKWAQVSVGALLIRHGTGTQALKGKCLLEYGPNYAHIGGHRQEVRRA